MRLEPELRKTGSVASAALLRRQVIGETTFHNRSAPNQRPEFDSDPAAWHTYHRLDASQTNLFQEPEKMLMFTILVDAISRFQTFSAADGTHRPRQFYEAKNWLLSNRQDWPFSYRNVCEALGLDADYLRRGLLRRINLPRPRIHRREMNRLPLRKAYHSGH
jgi:hypothetical protein